MPESLEGEPQGGGLASGGEPGNPKPGVHTRVTTLPLLMFNASMGGNYQVSSITALLLLVRWLGFMLVVERLLKADVLAMVGR